MRICERCGLELAMVTFCDGRLEYTIIIDPCHVSSHARHDDFRIEGVRLVFEKHRAEHGHGEFAIAVEGGRTDYVMGFVARLEAAIPDVRFMEGQELQSFLLASAVLAT